MINYNYTDIKTKTKILTILLVISIIIKLILCTSITYNIKLINKIQNGLEISETEIEKYEASVRILVISEIAIIILVIIFFFIWLNNAYKNIYTMKIQSIEYTPNWAVGWFFIPILNLFRPFQIIRELWKASNPEYMPNEGISWKSQNTEKIIIFFWTFYLISEIFLRGVIKLSELRETDTAEEMLRSCRITLFQQILYIISAILLIKIVRTITIMQKQKYLKISNNPIIDKFECSECGGLVKEADTICPHCNAKLED